MARLLSGSVRRVGWLSFALLWIAAPAAAQQAVQEAPAHISVAEGTVVLERDGRPDTAPASTPLLAGDRVRTQNGRVEILFADGSTLHLDANTTVDFQSDEVIRLLDGRVRVNISGPQRALAYRIDAPAAWVEIAQPGEYRVSILAGERSREVELAVLRGAAELVNEDGTTRVQAGERAFASAGLAPSQPYVFNSAAWDDFDQWSEARRTARLGVSAEYIPTEVQSYAPVFNHYGSWRHEPTYGYVWYPRVRVGWRPYFHGRWSHYRPWGWTWIGHDPWSWPTHHYGRWGFSAGAWFWIPGRHWGPAWVSWAYAPGYVSWCPLGFNNRPVFSFVNVNIFGGRRFDRWHGWTIVPHRRFGHGFVNVNVVNVNRLDAGVRRGFVLRERAPEFRGGAVSRSQTPIRVAGARSGFAVPRNGVGSDGAPSSQPQGVRAGGSRGTSLSGPGFPAPAREPNRSAVPRGSSRSAPAATAPAARSAPSRRAVPQDRTDPGRGGAVRRSPVNSAPPARPSATSPPSPSAAPSRQGPARGASSAPPSGRSRAVPRSSGGESSARSSSVAPRTESAPSAPARIQRYEVGPRASEPRIYRGTPPPVQTPTPRVDSPRAMPRSRGPEPSAPSYRPERSMPGRSPGVSRPAGPPSGGAPPRSVGTPSRGDGGRSSASPAPSRGGGSSSGGASRSRGGSARTGSARPRGGQR